MAFDNADIGVSTIVEPGAEIGFRYDEHCGRTRIGTHGIIRRGTLIYGDVSIGDHFQSGHNTVIRAKVRMGDYCTVTSQSTLEGLIRFGDGVRVMSHVYIPSRTWFGDRVFVGPGTVFLNERIPGRVDHGPTPRGATVENDVMIGGGCTILPGVTIGARSFIAAGTLVTKNIPAGSFVKGHPGRIEKLPPELDCENSPHLWRQSHDLWHPEANHPTELEWPADWLERY
jgi:acetyltransferase-like isoleucine patch superfamily enzyme